ncbi:MAG: hypothetical protein KC729_02840 [Candidatus Eisenbacteria bacterium]|uniref:Peptidase S55 domain-containing protein n=1 Tax=Eiseniibacteriota bacterium TaxID=2212470 RepID=A0A956LYJ3_UNCEI|nr:hypothetical protein [Candidatus Eisenbacteria bacterium]
MGLCWFAWCLGAPGPAWSADHPGPFLPIDEVQVGMHGVGRTVFQGDTIEEFDVEILGVLRNTRPQGDLILFRAGGDVLQHAGIIRGMSGSPVYIDGKLVGAVSFAYPGTMDPIGAITPIGEMLPLLANASGSADARDLEGTDARIGSGATQDGVERTPGSTDDGTGGVGFGSWSVFDRAWHQFLQPSEAAVAPFGADVASTTPHGTDAPWYRSLIPAAPEGGGSSSLVPLSTPVCLSGWSSALAAPMADAMQGLGFSAAVVPSGAGGTMSSGRSSATTGEPLQPGSAIGVRMIGGDADLVAIGTVTYVDSDRLVAFGHPMMQAGKVTFPMTGAWIHTVLPNRSVSMKMGSSTDLVGGVWNDRRTGIAGAFGTVPSMLPVHVEVEADGEAPQHFSYTVVRDKSLTPFLLPWTVANSYLVTGWVSGDAYVETTTEVFFDGNRHVRRVDKLASEAPGVELGANVTLPAALLLINPWEDARLDSVHIGVRYQRGNRSARIIEVRPATARIHVGESIRVTAVVEPFRGTPQSYGFDLKIPDAWAGRSLDVYVGATADFLEWDADRAPEKTVPHDLDHMISMIETVPDDSQITMRVYAPEPGTLIRGQELPDLPPSLARATRNVPHVDGPRPVSGSLLEERHLGTPWVVSGGERISLEVAEQ